MEDILLRTRVAKYARIIRRVNRAAATGGVRNRNRIVRKMCQAYVQELAR